jgi:hypothetical protein
VLSGVKLVQCIEYGVICINMCHSYADESTAKEAYESIKSKLT